MPDAALLGKTVPAHPPMGALAHAPPDKSSTHPRAKPSNAQGRNGKSSRAGLTSVTCGSAKALVRPDRRRIEAFIDTTLRTRNRYSISRWSITTRPPASVLQREEFPWLPDFEAAPEAIQRSLPDPGRGRSGLQPYIHYETTCRSTIGRTQQSPRLSAFHFYRLEADRRCRRAPATMEAVHRLPIGSRLRSPTAWSRVAAQDPPPAAPRAATSASSSPAAVCRTAADSACCEQRNGGCESGFSTTRSSPLLEQASYRIILICDLEPGFQARTRCYPVRSLPPDAFTASAFRSYIRAFSS